jgi:hypothetical protein
LEINPTLWAAYEKLAKLGDSVQGAKVNIKITKLKIFTDQKQKNYEETRKANNCNIFKTITNLIHSKGLGSKTNSSQKE